ncbi:hypothetical protein [Chryseobacterium sp. SC28]|uniref:hypothetical protein n=1 Tax=Chryseobacterium sp. SC28 TaxID=2268028 RepID=UPI000F64CEC5|nr:hypothetical protein [Chryseobacterium sp. SC28]RRQ47060.1 hypothetical protein DTW91_02450 [Chryseobacterium sp. SC28]
MKPKFSIFLLAIVLLFSCQNDDGDTQSIDQVLRLYMRSSTTGQDLLNPKIEGSYSTPVLLDLLGERDLQSISGYSFLKDADTVVYLEYVAGAVRLKIDSLSDDTEQTYYSKFIIRLPKTVNTLVVNDDDTIKIEYKNSPSLFQISKLWYNDELKFTKVPGQPNTVKIVK